MFTLITILVIIICFLLLLIVLIQNPKGGLDSAFSSNNQIMGVRKTTNFLEKATWSLGIALVILSIASSAVNPTKTISDGEAGDSKIKELIDEKAAPAMPNMNNAPVPAQENQEGK